MKKIGMIVAIEIDTVLNRYGKPITEKDAAGCRILEYRTEKYSLVVAHCAVGEIAALSGGIHLEVLRLPPQVFKIVLTCTRGCTY